MEGFPKKISPCPIIETVIQIRFSSVLPPEAIFGILYSKIKDKFDENIRKLPILQIPEAIRTHDPNLAYQAHYSLVKSDAPLQLNIGPRTITFSNSNEYIGWDSYSSFVREILDQIKDTEVIKTPESIGIRYINFFGMQILDKINLDIKISEKKLLTESTTIRTELKEQDFVNAVQVMNNVVANVNGIQKTGSVIDIDCVYKYKNTSSPLYEDFFPIIQKGHGIEKKIFFELLKSDFLNSFTLEY